MQTIKIDSPLDMHVHFRQDMMLAKVVPITARNFSGALVMPNLSPPLWRPQDIVEYRQKIESVAGEGFRPYMTAYFNTDMNEDYLESVKPHILAIKFYPKGMTTNSDHGTNPQDPKILKVLSAMEKAGIPLCVHGETEGFCMDREYAFGFIYNEWARTFPKLKIIMEHITDRRSVTLLIKHSNLFATITPHHLLWTLDAVVGDLLNPHAFCKPILKTPLDRELLQQAAMSVGTSRPFELSDCVINKVMLGTDSAPHNVIRKESECGCAGVFNAPIALQVLAGIFENNNALDKLQGFVSDNARRIYGIDPPKKTITLVKRDNVVPKIYFNEVVPMLAGKTINWDVV